MKKIGGGKVRGGSGGDGRIYSVGNDLSGNLSSVRTQCCFDPQVCSSL